MFLKFVIKSSQDTWKSPGSPSPCTAARWSGANGRAATGTQTGAGHEGQEEDSEQAVESYQTIEVPEDEAEQAIVYLVVDENGAVTQAPEGMFVAAP